MKKILCIVLCVVVLASVLCVSAFATDTPTRPQDFSNYCMASWIWEYVSDSSSTPNLSPALLYDVANQVTIATVYWEALTINPNRGQYGAQYRQDNGKYVFYMFGYAVVDASLAGNYQLVSQDLQDWWTYYGDSDVNYRRYNYQSAYNEFWDGLYSWSDVDYTFEYELDDGYVFNYWLNTISYHDANECVSSFNHLTFFMCTQNDLNSNLCYTRSFICDSNSVYYSDVTDRQGTFVVNFTYEYDGSNWYYRQEIWLNTMDNPNATFTCEGNVPWDYGESGGTGYNFSGTFIQVSDGYQFRGWAFSPSELLFNKYNNWSGLYNYTITNGSTPPGPGPEPETDPETEPETEPQPEPVVREFHTSPFVMLLYTESDSSDLMDPVPCTVTYNNVVYLSFTLYDMYYGTPIQNDNHDKYLHMYFAFVGDVVFANDSDYDLIFTLNCSLLPGDTINIWKTLYYVSEYNDFWTENNWSGFNSVKFGRERVTTGVWHDTLSPYSSFNLDAYFDHISLFDYYGDLNAKCVSYLCVDNYVTSAPMVFDGGSLLYADLTYRDRGIFQIRSNVYITGGLYEPNTFTCEGDINWTDGMGNTHYNYSGIFDGGYYRTVVPQDYGDFVMPYNPWYSDPNMYMCGYYPYEVTSQSFAQPWIDFHTNVLGHIFEYFAELPNNYAALTAFVTAVLFLCGVTTCVVLFFKRRRG